MERLKQAGHRIIIGVDFGTTFTGVGWVDTASGSNVQDVFLINDWGGKAKTCDYNWKVPTIVAYQDENSSKSMKDDKWGFEVESSMVSWSWMKLLLDKGQAETHYDDSLQEVKQHPLKTAEQMISDYLRGVYQFLVKKLERRFGGEAVGILPFEFWFTIPAIWSDQAKVTTKRAAQAAGFASRPGDKIFLIPEPEAAAVAVLKELTHHGDSVFVEPGNGMIICDCGGGTIDITTYAICQTEPTLEFDEVVVGAGGKCGSTYIDRRFLIWMSNTFGSGFDNLPDRLKSPGSKLMKAFESAKREFKVGGYESYEVSLHIPGVRDSDFYDEDESQVKIPWSTMEAFFQPAVQKIIKLVQAQMDEAQKTGVRVNKIVLVGGFGDSEYLYAQLKVACASKHHIEVICPKYPQAAIVKGAALRGLENIKPRRKRCRRHYGFAISLKFREGVDSEKDAWYCKIDKVKWCNKRIQWAMSKGQRMEETTFFTNQLQDWKPKDQAKVPCTMKLYCSTFEQPAERTYENGVQEVGEITVTTDTLDMSKFESKLQGLKRYYRIQYTLQVFPSTKDGILCFKVISQGKELGFAQIAYLEM